jgi:hypothetical protein
LFAIAGAKSDSGHFSPGDRKGSGSGAMWHNRDHPRQLTLKTATILGAGENSGVSCAILNTSAGGFCLLVAAPDTVPDTFDLIVDPDGARHSCTVAWKSGNRIGVRFSDPAAPGLVPDFEPASAPEE